MAANTFLGLDKKQWGMASAGLQLGAGIADFISSRGQASLFEMQGEMALIDAKHNALLIRSMAQQTAQQQKADYLSSGVNFGGSGVITIAQTKSWAEAEARSYEIRGEIQKSMSKISATRTKYAGISSMINSVFGAVTSYGLAVTK
jgi:hypothetical protein